MSGRRTMKTIWKIKNLLKQESLQEVDEREAIEVLATAASRLAHLRQ